MLLSCLRLRLGSLLADCGLFSHLRSDYTLGQQFLITLIVIDSLGVYGLCRFQSGVRGSNIGLGCFDLSRR